MKTVPKTVPRNDPPSGRLYKRGRRWWYRLCVGGVARDFACRPQGASRATTDKSVAKTIARRIYRRYKGVEDVSETMRDVVARFEQLTVLSSGVRQAQQNASVARRFAEARQITDPAAITTADVEAYLSDLLTKHKRAPATIVNHRTSLSRFCGWLENHGYLESNPVKRTRPPRIPRKHPRFLSPAEFDQCLDLAREHGIYEIVAIALYTGLRLGHLMKLRWNDVDFAGRMLRPLSLEPNLGKSAGLIPISAKLREVLEDIGPGRPGDYILPQQDKMTWLRAFEPIRNAMPIFEEAKGARTGRAFHLLRHTFASRAVQAGVPLEKIGLWLGHRDPRTTAIYAHLQPGYDADIEKI